MTTSASSAGAVALGLIRDRETAQCISGPTWADRYTAFVNYKTAEALRARGLITIGPSPDYEIRLAGAEVDDGE